ncbi:MAG: hypothetical protein IPP14_15085 [Planctomycetes bacterium]|nr:hypothetical protein [Planctomycetota bacterium]
MVLAPAASRYEGRIMLLGCALAVLAFLGAFVFSDYALNVSADPPLLLLEGVVLGALGAWFCNRVPAIKRLLIPRWKQLAAVDMAAQATFTRENISLTRQRNACLLFISVLEGELRLMPDIGLQQKVHDSKLGEIKAALANAKGDPVAALEEALLQLGMACGECFPRPADDTNELPDKPLIRLP